MIKTTYSEMFQRQGYFNEWLSRDEKNPKTKPGTALRRLLDQIDQAAKGYNRQVNDLNADHCAIDKDGVILTSEGGRFKFTPKGLKALNEAIGKLDESEVKIQGLAFSPNFEGVELDELDREHFAGWVIKEEAHAAIAEHATT